MGRCPLDKAAQGGWVGLSEITAFGDDVYIIERDKQIGDKARIKKLYRISIADLKAQTKGYAVDKLGGTFGKAGKAYAVTDNAGVDDSSGETPFFPVDINVTNRGRAHRRGNRVGFASSTMQRWKTSGASCVRPRARTALYTAGFRHQLCLDVFHPLQAG